MRAAIVLLSLVAAFAASAVKHKKAATDPAEELERLRTDLRLRNAELAVARSQLAACRRSCRGLDE